MKKRIKGIVKSALLKLHGGVIIEWWHSYLRTYLFWKYQWHNRRAFLSAWREQRRYEKMELRKKTLVVFVLYGKMRVNGGIMSIFNIAATSRIVLGEDASIVICTGPGNLDLYAKNPLFPNNEKVWRWGQVRRGINCKVEKLILHLPECYVVDFLRNLSRQDRRLFRSVRDLRINIMNQNIWYMPTREAFAPLYEFTDKITQTIAHSKYNSQEMSNKFGLPTMRIGTHMSYDVYKRYEWNHKQKIIAYSPDRHPMRDEILEEMQKTFHDYLFVEIKDITFLEYMDLIARAMAVITFGEGMDGYFLQPAMVGTLSFAVYNTDFFGSKDWLSLSNVFKSYFEMKSSICAVMSKAVEKEETYYQHVNATRRIVVRSRLDDSTYKNNIKRFYDGDFDYYPIQNS